MIAGAQGRVKTINCSAPVTAADLSEALARQGFDVDKRRIQLAEPIKVVGEYTVAVKLVHDVTADFKVIVTREP